MRDLFFLYESPTLFAEKDKSYFTRFVWIGRSHSNSWSYKKRKAYKGDRKP